MIDYRKRLTDCNRRSNWNGEGVAIFGGGTKEKEIGDVLTGFDFSGDRNRLAENGEEANGGRKDSGLLVADFGKTKR